MTATYFPAWPGSGTDTHAAPHGTANTTAAALCGQRHVIRGRGDYTALALGSGGTMTLCRPCLAAVVQAMA